MKIFYRISDGNHKKNKPDWITKQNCLDNAYEHFAFDDWNIIADHITTSETNELVTRYETRSNVSVTRTDYANGSESFRFVLNKALELSDDEIVYFIEDDYLHRDFAKDVLLDGFALGADFVSLYDHPDKYISPEQGGNPEAPEQTVVYLGSKTHWKLTNSTTMTFATKVSTLRECKDVFMKHTESRQPNDFQMFLELRNMNKTLITPIPGYSTHGETMWLAPGIDWSNELS